VASMLLFKKLLAIAFSVALGLVFIYSGYTKLLPVIETFEFSFVDLGLANWYTAPVFARVLIALEFFIGALLISNYNLKKFTLPLTIGLLTFFILYLILQIIISGNDGNCGCFGEHIKMTPFEAILKNVVMIGISVFVYFTTTGWKIKYNILILAAFLCPSIAIPFAINPIDYSYTSNNLDEKINYPLELDLLFSPSDTTEVEIPSIDIRKGKQVVAFLSLSCSHCRIAAKKFKLIKKENPSLPIYFILNGDKTNLDAFIKDTRADNIPYSFCNGKSFVQLASSRLPRIYYLDNSIVVQKVDYFELNQYAIETWINEGTLP